jgi:hypothetical protein
MDRRAALKSIIGLPVVAHLAQASDVAVTAASPVEPVQPPDADEQKRQRYLAVLNGYLAEYRLDGVHVGSDRSTATAIKEADARLAQVCETRGLTEVSEQLAIWWAGRQAYTRAVGQAAADKAHMERLAAMTPQERYDYDHPYDYVNDRPYDYWRGFGAGPGVYY